MFSFGLVADLLELEELLYPRSKFPDKIVRHPVVGCFEGALRPQVDHLADVHGEQGGLQLVGRVLGEVSHVLLQLVEGTWTEVILNNWEK